MGKPYPELVLVVVPLAEPGGVHGDETDSPKVGLPQHVGFLLVEGVGPDPDALAEGGELSKLLEVMPRDGDTQNLIGLRMSPWPAEGA